MMLDLKIGPGRRSANLIVDEGRALHEGDLEILRGERATQPMPIKALRERHHAIARFLAEGKRPMEIAAIVGFTISRISILQSDPTFRDLVAFYTRERDASFADLHSQLAGMSLDAAIMLRERMEDTPDEITDTKLLEIIKLGADRTGLGPKSSQDVNINIGLADRLAEARKRVAERRMIDVTPERKTG